MEKSYGVDILVLLMMEHLKDSSTKSCVFSDFRENINDFGMVQSLYEFSMPILFLANIHFVGVFRERADNKGEENGI